MLSQRLAVRERIKPCGSFRCLPSDLPSLVSERYANTFLSLSLKLDSGVTARCSLRALVTELHALKCVYSRSRWHLLWCFGCQWAATFLLSFICIMLIVRLHVSLVKCTSLCGD